MVQNGLHRALDTANGAPLRRTMTTEQGACMLVQSLAMHFCNYGFI